MRLPVFYEKNLPDPVFSLSICACRVYNTPVWQQISA